eukprot:scaffold7885_cov403-Prasinococcus_capsulatus_cf.AAC.3
MQCAYVDPVLLVEAPQLGGEVVDAIPASLGAVLGGHVRPLCHHASPAVSRDRAAQIGAAHRQQLRIRGHPALP